MSSLLTVGAFQFGSLLLSTSSTLDHSAQVLVERIVKMGCNSPVKKSIDEPNFSGSVGTAYTRLNSSDPVHILPLLQTKG